MPPPTASAAPPWVLSLTVFAGGFAVMALEMCGFRVVTTEYGSSVFTTGSLLTWIMVALSGGYYLGGRVSRRAASMRPLAVMWLLTALYAFLAHRVFAQGVLDWGFSLRAKLEAHPLAMQIVPPTFAVAVLYGVPMLLLATTTPFAVQASSRAGVAGDVADAGKTAGNLMALSTAGSILGTLLTSYAFIPQFGTRRTILGFCASLCVVGGLLLWSDRGRARVSTALLLGALGFGVLFVPLPSRAKEGLVHTAETSYNRVEISRGVAEDGEPYLLYEPSRVYEHSLVYPSRPLKDQRGLSYLTSATARGAKRVLVLGTAAGGSLLQLLALTPDVEIVGVELDPAVLEISRDLFGVPRSPRVRLEALDARVFLRQSKETFDFIIVDLFAGEFIPPHCATREFFALVRAHLHDDGLVFVNSNMQDFPWSDAETEGAFRPLWHLQSAMRRAGFETIFQNDLYEDGYLYAFPGAVALEDFRARLLAMAGGPGAFEELRAEAVADALKTVVASPGHVDAEPFTDDWSPDDRLQLQGNLIALTRELAGEPPPRPASEAADLKARIARELARFLHEEGRWGISEERYCRELLDWASRTQGPLLEPLARLHVPFVDCEAWAEAGAADARSRLVADYTHALKITTEDRGPEALPLLLDVAARLR